MSNVNTGLNCTRQRTNTLILRIISNSAVLVSKYLSYSIESLQLREAAAGGTKNIFFWMSTVSYGMKWLDDIKVLEGCLIEMTEVIVIKFIIYPLGNVVFLRYGICIYTYEVDTSKDSKKYPCLCQPYGCKYINDISGSRRSRKDLLDMTVIESLIAYI